MATRRTVYRTAERPSVLALAIVAGALAVVLCTLGVAAYGLFMAFITNGALTYFNNATFAAEVFGAYGFGICAAVLIEHLNICFNRRSIFSNPGNLILYSLVIIVVITLVQYLHPSQFGLHQEISQAMDVRDNLLVALAADFVTTMVTLLTVGTTYNWLFWNVINRRFRWVNAQFSSLR